jgi:hypothetical protein
MDEDVASERQARTQKGPSRWTGLWLDVCDVTLTPNWAGWSELDQRLPECGVPPLLPVSWVGFDDPLPVDPLPMLVWLVFGELLLPPFIASLEDEPCDPLLFAMTTSPFQVQSAHRTTSADRTC